MLKTRVIPTLLFKEFGLVKGRQFDSRRAVGSPVQAISVYERRDVDELLFLDVVATLNGAQPDFALVDELADACFMPLTVGGGVRSADDVGRLLEVGADKVCIGSAATEDLSVVEESASRFGNQCVVVAIDWRISDSSGEPEVWTHSGTKRHHVPPAALARSVEDAGAGEIVATSIDRDGLMEGYDIENLSRVTGAVRIPVVASGGAGTYEHLRQAIVDGGANAVAASSMFLFTEQTPRAARVFLGSHGIPVRS